MNGTRILSARGPVDVDSLQAGSQVVVLRDGQEVLESVKWIGRCKIDLSRQAHVEDCAPICLRPGAIADNQPTRALYLSPEHCLIIDGLCVPARFLVNGGTIISERDYPPFTYYHVELERHGILIAEDALAESYLDTGNRSQFDNAEEPDQLHPSFTANSNAGRWLTDACAPLVRVSDQLPPIWHRLAERSERMGFAVSAMRTVSDPDVHILADGERIDAISDRDCRYIFALPAGLRSVALASRVCIPADRMGSTLRDRRRLGVSVSWIEICSDNNAAIFSADHPALSDGWNEVEQSGPSMWRWTEGVAAIPWENILGPAMVTIRCTPVDQYPVCEAQIALVA
jgi:antigen 43